MPDFKKGDFTQQGVAGHVNANLRLNEKRLVNIDLTSNEEAEGCTIAGTVTDLLNDKVYNIGSGGGGGEEETLTFTLIPEDDYTTELDSGDNIIFDITSLGMFAGVYADTVTVNINNTDVTLNVLTPGGATYRNEDGVELNTTLSGSYLILPEAGTYHIKASITLTGKPVEVVNTENGFIFAEVGNYHYLYCNNTINQVILNAIIADKIVPFSNN